MVQNLKQHELFFSTSYSINEIVVYEKNNLLSKIKEKIPDYNDTILKLNNYSVFYRTCPKWEIYCQEFYSTYEFSEECKKTGYVSGNSKVILALSFLVYVISFANIPLIIQF
jgi:hypothetical protein